MARRYGSIVIVTAALVIPAIAGGSLGFDEVMSFANSNPNLVAEIQKTLKDQHLNDKDVYCSASRFGGHWEHLSAGRALPFSCEIGKKTITIDGDIEFLDERGRVIPNGLDNPNVFKNAHSIREKNPTWEWSDTK